MRKTVDQLIVEYQEGEGERKPDPILFIHGMWSGSWYWANFMEYFSKLGYDCWALNLRGHEPDPKLRDIGKVSFAQYVEDVDKAIAELGTLPIIIGHSMGGLLAQKVAEISRTKAVVLLAPAPPWSVLTIHYLPLLLSQLKHLPDLILNRPLIPSYGLAVKMMLDCLAEEERRRIYSKVVPESGRVAAEILLGKVVIDKKRVTCPVLVIAGGDDKIISAKVAKRVAQGYKADFKEYPDRGHWMMEEGWEKIAHDTGEWLDKTHELQD